MNENENEIIWKGTSAAAGDGNLARAMLHAMTVREVRNSLFPSEGYTHERETMGTTPWGSEIVIYEKWSPREGGGYWHFAQAKLPSSREGDAEEWAS